MCLPEIGARWQAGEVSSEQDIILTSEADTIGWADIESGVGHIARRRRCEVGRGRATRRHLDRWREFDRSEIIGRGVRREG